MSTEQPGQGGQEITGGDITGAAAAVASAIVNAAIGGILASLTILGALAAQAWDLVVKVADWLKNLCDRILKPLIERLEKLLNKLHRIYNKILRPVLKQIQKQRAIIRRIYELYFRPVLEVIAALRVFLAVTRLNNTALGRALDRRLANLEGKISKPILAALGVINDHTRWLNILLAPDLLFQSVTHVRSVIKSLGNIADAFYNLSRVKDTVPRDALLSTIPPRSNPAEERKNFEDAMLTDSGPLAVQFATDNTRFHSLLAS